MNHSINLLVDFVFQGAVLLSNFDSLTLTQVFDDSLFEVILRVDISITDQGVSLNGRSYSSFVEFHISIPCD